MNIRGLEIDNCHDGLTYTHRLKFGVAPTDDYGIVLAELSGLPMSVIERARKYASARMVYFTILLLLIFCSLLLNS